MKFVLFITFQKNIEEFHTKNLTILLMAQLFMMIMAYGILKFVFFTEEEFARTKMNEPGFQIKVLNVAKKDNDLFNVEYKLTPYAIKYGNDFDALYLQKNIEGVYGIKK